MTDHINTLIADVEQFLTRYVTFPSPDYAFAAALWSVGTYLWMSFDAYPYLVITSSTKRSGKSRFSEVLQFVSNNPYALTGVTVATIFRLVKMGPTMFIDEAESLSSGDASTMRSVLNSGYRKGSMVPRIQDNEVVNFGTYCPKAFVLIGDVYDTLRDRSIVVWMQRGTARDRFVYDVAKVDGEALRGRMLAMVAAQKAAIVDAYTTHEGLPFLADRDEEIWTPLFAIAAVLCPDRITELQRVAVDLSTAKTADARRHTTLAGAEEDADLDEYAKRLLNDLLMALGSRKSVFTAEALDLLHKTPTGPWRKFRGEGLNAMDMANLLSRFGIRPKLIKVGSRSKNERVARGYTRKAIEDAVNAL